MRCGYWFCLLAIVIECCAQLSIGHRATLAVERRSVVQREMRACSVMFVFVFRPTTPPKSVPAFPCMNMTARVPEGPRDLRAVFHAEGWSKGGVP